MSSNVRQGLWWGAAFATLYSLAAVGIFVLHAPGPFHANGVSLPAVLALYWVGGLAGGLIYGLLLPLGRTLAGAMVLGFLVALPVAAAASLLVERQSRTPAPILVIGFAALMGPLCGAGIWYQARRSS
jgi:hypothetical protein